MLTKHTFPTQINQPTNCAPNLQLSIVFTIPTVCASFMIAPFVCSGLTNELNAKIKFLCVLGSVKIYFCFTVQQTFGVFFVIHLKSGTTRIVSKSKVKAETPNFQLVIKTLRLSHCHLSDICLAFKPAQEFV